MFTINIDLIDKNGNLIKQFIPEQELTTKERVIIKQVQIISKHMLVLEGIRDQERKLIMIDLFSTKIAAGKNINFILFLIIMTQNSNFMEKSIQNNLKNIFIQNLNLHEQDALNKSQFILKQKKEEQIDEDIILSKLQLLDLNNYKLPEIVQKEKGLQIHLQKYQLEEKVQKEPEDYFLQICEFDQYTKSFRKVRQQYQDHLRDVMRNSRMKKFLDKNMNFNLFIHIQKNYDFQLYLFDVDNESFYFNTKIIKKLFYHFNYNEFQQKISYIIEKQQFKRKQLDYDFKIAFFTYLNLYRQFFDFYFKCMHLLDIKQFIKFQLNNFCPMMKQSFIFFVQFLKQIYSSLFKFQSLLFKSKHFFKHYPLIQFLVKKYSMTASFQLINKIQIMKNEVENVKVFVRIRPVIQSTELNKSIKQNREQIQNTLDLNKNGQILDPKIKKSFEKDILDISQDNSNLIEFRKLEDNKILQTQNGKLFEFDAVFDHKENNNDIFNTMMIPNMEYIMKGNNFSIFVYGQTCSGKTFTMKGNKEIKSISKAKQILTMSDIKKNIQLSKQKRAFQLTQINCKQQDGIIQKTLFQIFEKFKTKDCQFRIKINYFEIYNERIYDLFSLNQNTLEIRENKEGEIIILDIKSKGVKTYKEAIQVFQQGEERRHFASTEFNHNSSRSHVIFTVEVEFKMKSNLFKIYKSKITMADLAGSEGIGIGRKVKQIKEGSHINKSLLALTSVIKKLNKNSNFVSFRESKLTRLLKPVLTGNSRTYVICTINPLKRFISESLNTIRFGASARNLELQMKDKVVSKQEIQNIMNKGKENEKELKQQLKDYQKKIMNQESEIQKINCLYKSLADQNNVQQQQIEGLQSINKILEENKDTRRQKFIDLQQSIQKYKKSKDEMKEKKKVITVINENQNQQIDLINENKELKKQIRQISFKMNFGKKKLTFENKKCQQKVKNDMSKEDYKNFNKQIEKQLKNYKSIESKYEFKIRKLKEQLNSKNERIKNLTKSLSQNFSLFNQLQFQNVKQKL